MRDPVQRNVPPRPGGGGGEAAGPGRKAEPSGATGTMSIGEVLGILKPEFPDITVSKIRFLEGAGLVQPDRSASGYRKFSEDDVARLRFVLRAQRDQYLPLRVIRQRLADLEQVGGLPADPTAQPDQGAATGQAPGAPGRGSGSAASSSGAGRPGRGTGTGRRAGPGRDGWDRAGTGAVGTGPGRPGPERPGPQPGGRGRPELVRPGPGRRRPGLVGRR